LAEPEPEKKSPPLMIVAPVGLSDTDRTILLSRLERASPVLELPPGASLFQLVGGRWETLATIRKG